MSYNGWIYMHIVRNSFMIGTLLGGFVRRHANAVAYHVGKYLIRPDWRQVQILPASDHLYRICVLLWFS